MKFLSDFPTLKNWLTHHFIGIQKLFLPWEGAFEHFLKYCLVECGPVGQFSDEADTAEEA